MRVYAEVARRSFIRHSSYRGATIAGVFTNSVFAFIRAYTLLAVYEQRADVRGLDAVGAVTFVFVSQGFLLVIGAFGVREIAERVRTGDIATDLYRPLDFSGYWLANDLGRSAFSLFGRGIPPVLLGSLFFDLRLPSSPIRWVAFLVCVVFSAALASRFWLIVNLAAFWVVEVRGVIQLAVLVLMFCTGIMFPLQFLPGALGTIVRLTPFAAMVQFPIEVFVGLRDPLPVLGVQLLWFVVLHGIGLFVLGRAVRKVVVQGG